MDFPLPPVGEGLIEVELVRWLVRAGDAVQPGQGLAEVLGSGPHGRILLDDLSPFLNPRPAGPVEKPAGVTDTSTLDFGVAGTRIKLVGLRRRIAEHMVAAKQHIPHYSYVDECDLT